MDAPFFYILDSEHHVFCVGNNIERWGAFFKQTSARRVAFDEINGVKISTVFCGMDSAIPPNPARPLLFETMIFRGEDDECFGRCATWREAEAQHKNAVDIERGQ